MQFDPGEMFGSRPVASCRGIDEAREVLGDVFLPVDFPTARATNRVDMKLNALTVGGLTCGYMRFSDAVRIETAEAKNFHVDIPMAGQAWMRAARGTPIYGTRTTAAVFMPGRPAVLDCGEGFAQLSLMLSRSQLEQELENLLGIEAVQPLEFRAELDVAAPGGQMLMESLQLIDAASGQAIGPLAHPLAAQRLEQVVMHSLLFGQPHNHTAALAAPVRAAGARPVAQAVELLRARPAHPWTVAELAAAVSLSVRSLQEGFRRSVGTTPMTYLRRLRLDRVHDELAAADPGTVSVTDVASRWGFVHLGRFAAAYRSAFSERPSDTLRSVGGRPKP